MFILYYTIIALIVTLGFYLFFKDAVGFSENKKIHLNLIFTLGFFWWISVPFILYLIYSMFQSEKEKDSE